MLYHVVEASSGEYQRSFPARVAAPKRQAVNMQRLQLTQRVNLYLALGGEW